MKRIMTFSILLSLLMVLSCSRFVDFKPKGVVSSEELNTPVELDKTVTAAYATLSNDFFWSQMASIPWIWGSVRADDAYKGGGNTGDNFDQHMMETYNLLTPSVGQLNDIWKYLYENIGRANDALRRLEAFTVEQYPKVNQ